MKEILDTEEKYNEKLKTFIANFLNENPIYRRLDLSEQQIESLTREVILPLFAERFEITPAVSQSLYKECKRLGLEPIFSASK